MVLSSSITANALSDEDYTMYMEEVPYFAEQEKALNEAWKELKSLLPPDEYKKALAEQRAWLKQRDSEVARINSQRGAAAKADGNLGGDYAAVTYTRVEELKLKIAARRSLK